MIPTQPIPDDKDWTWVLDRPCPECGFDTRSLDVTDLGNLVRANADEWRTVLADPVAASRSVADRWSALEYACHVRDVFQVYLGRLDRMLTEDGPHYENWDQDRTAVEQRYDLATPSAVVVELADAAERLARRFDDVTGDDWRRTGYRSDGASFTIDTFGRYFIHDPIHHLWDVDGRTAG